jgi:hypothetical protein
MAPKHVIAPPKIGGPIDHSDSRGFFHDADHAGIAARILTDAAGLIFGQITAFLAGAYSLGYRGKYGGEPPDLFGGLLEQMKGEPLRSLSADAREPCELCDQLLDCAHRLERRCQWQLRDFPHFGLEHLRCPALGFSHRGQDQVTEELGITILKDRGIDPDSPDGATAIGSNLHHATTRRGLDGSVGQLGLQLLKPALYLLAELKKLLKICHAVG